MRSSDGQNAQAQQPAHAARALRRSVAAALVLLACSVAAGALATTPAAPPHAALPHASHDALTDSEREVHARVVALVDRGSFNEATAAIDAALAARGTSAASRAALAFERERMRRIRMDFPLTTAEVRAQLQRDIPDLREEKPGHWVAPVPVGTVTDGGRA